MSGDSPHVIAVAGPNGAGKTTLAPFLIRDDYGLMEYVNADSIAQGLAAFSPESVAFEAGRIMLRRINALANQNLSFAFETRLASRSYARLIKGYAPRGTNSTSCTSGLTAPTSRRSACVREYAGAGMMCRKTLSGGVTSEARGISSRCTAGWLTRGECMIIRARVTR